MNNLILKQLELYKKILELNKEIKKDFNLETVETLIKKRDALIEEVKIIDKKLQPLWDNWEKLKSSVNTENIKKIKEILTENMALEEEILKIFQNKLKEIKFKLKDYDKGKKALHGYRQVKVNIPMFKSFKI